MYPFTRPRCRTKERAHLSDSEKNGPLEGRHSAFPRAERRASMHRQRRRRTGVRQGRQNALPPKARLLHPKREYACLLAFFRLRVVASRFGGVAMR